jgi:hypothetical protein
MPDMQEENPTYEEIMAVAAEFEDNRVKMAREIMRLRSELAKWESGELFSKHAARLYENQRAELRLFREALQNVYTIASRASAEPEDTAALVEIMTRIETLAR